MNAKIAVQIFGGLLREGYFQPAINNHIEKARKKVKFLFGDNTNSKIRNTLALLCKVYDSIAF